MANEYQLSYTASEIDERLEMVSSLNDKVNDLENNMIADKQELKAYVDEVVGGIEEALAEI